MLTRMSPLIINRFYTSLPAVAIRYRKLTKYSYEDEIAFVRDYLRDRGGGLFIDVGAHLGTWTSWIANRTQPVLAFEPNPSLADLLRRSRISNTEVLEFALGATTGSAELKIPFRDGLPRPGNGTITDFRLEPSEPVLKAAVSVRKLDDFFLGHVAALKVDCEGGEEHVLLGATAVIERDRPLLVVEIHHDRLEDFIKVSELLSAFGYSSNWLNQGQLVSIFEEERRPLIDNVVFHPGT